MKIRKQKKLVMLLSLFTVLSLLLIGCSAPKQPADNSGEKKDDSSTQDAFKVALMMTGPINDAGWNESSYKGLMKAKESLGIEVAYSENLLQPDFETAARDYAEKGYDLIILSSFDFSDAAKAVAPQYPDIQFALVNGGAEQEPNLANFRFNTPESGFLAGAFAGLITKSNTVGMVGGQKFPVVQDAAAGFEAGAKYVNPNANVLKAYIDSWSDIPKAKETALAMIEQGADVVVGNASQAGLGVIEAAKSKGKYALGYIYDQYKVAPGTVPFSTIQSIEDLIVEIVQTSKAEPLKPQTYVIGAKEGIIRLSAFYEIGQDPVPDEVKQKMEEILNGLKDGSLKQQGILPKTSFEK